MYDKEAWLRERYAESVRDRPERKAAFRTSSELELDPVYGPEDVDAATLPERLGLPGTYPYARGIHPSMHRGKLWTMRMFAGFGTAERTNARFRRLTAEGQTGLSTAFDLPTLMGYDSDDPMSRGEVGVCGVAIDTLADMELLFDGIDPERITTSMTINAPANAIWAMYLAMAERKGADLAKVGGTLQNDILKEFLAQKEYAIPPAPSVDLVIDTFAWGPRHAPRFHFVSVSGYHIREAGSTAAQELAFTLANGIHYVRRALDRGLDVDDFAPRMSFFFNVENHVFEEVAKFRAARRIWARWMRERFGARDPRSWMLRTHAQTAGASLTAQQPQVNVARVAIQALTAVLAGTNSLHTDAYDEALSLPSEQAALLALRTQQVIAHETGAADVADPLGGSWYLEHLTDALEAEADAYLDRIDELGGVEAGIEDGFFAREIGDAAYRRQKRIDAGEEIVVGVNAFVTDAPEVPVPPTDPDAVRTQTERLARIRAERDPDATSAALARLREAATTGANTMPAFLACAHAFVTLQEQMDVLRAVHGSYLEPVTV
ncbi:MAG: methylmalonyl-CoA mutase family protein [Trueperaceae bacterium]